MSLNLPNQLSKLASACTNEYINGIKFELNAMREHLQTKEEQINKLAKSAFENIKDKEQLITDIDTKISQCQEIKNRIELC